MVKHVDSNERLLLLGHRKQFTGSNVEVKPVVRRARAANVETLRSTHDFRIIYTKKPIAAG